MMMAILLVLGFVVLAVFMAAPRRKHRLPATEQFVLSLLHLSAWIERTATAADNISRLASVSWRTGLSIPMRRTMPRAGGRRKEHNEDR
jgi:hypothetical protein